jgi:hypothetical protein
MPNYSESLQKKLVEMVRLNQTPYDTGLPAPKLVTKYLSDSKETLAMLQKLRDGFLEKYNAATTETAKGNWAYKNRRLDFKLKQITTMIQYGEELAKAGKVYLPPWD